MSEREHRCLALQTEDGLLDITPLLSFPQVQAAEILGYATSTLSKRWTEVKSDQTDKESFTWPFRRIKRIDTQVHAIVRPLDPSIDEEIPDDVQSRLSALLDEREELTEQVFIRRITH